MDPGVSACIKRAFIGFYLLLGSTCYSETADTSCTCGGVAIPPQPLTKPPDCSQMKDQRFRYTCIDGYVRKAGSSNLIRCENNKWSTFTLKCIENPQKTTPTSTRFSTSAVTPSIISETHLETTSTALPTQHISEGSFETTTLPQSSTKGSFETTTLPQSSTTSPTSAVTSSDTTSTASPPQHSPEASLETTPLPQSSTRPSQLDRTTSPSRLSSNSTASSRQNGESVVTSVITPVVILLIVVAAGGAVFWLYKRRSRTRSHRGPTERGMTVEETVPMHQHNGNT